MNILLAEDDTILADALTAHLRGSGYTVEHAPNGPVAEFLLQRQSFDLSILDLGLPMVDGLSVLRQIRSTNQQMPVIVLTAQDALESRVAGLDAGADDYITKPFDFPELDARVRALLRRAAASSPTAELGFGKLSFSPKTRRLTIAGEPVELSPREWLLIELLLVNRDNVVTKDQIAQTWAADGNGTGAGNGIEVYIHRLRRRLEGSGLDIRTVRGLGYLLEADGKAPSTLQRALTRAMVSLHRKLLLWLLLPQLILWVAGGIVTYRLAANYANHAIDASLAQASRALLRQVKPIEQGLLIDFPRAAQEILEADPKDRLMYMVSNPPGRFILGNNNLPPPPPMRVTNSTSPTSTMARWCSTIPASATAPS